MPPTASEFDYRLPRERIAQEPVSPRDASRLMVLQRRTGLTADRLFSDLPGLLERGDLLVLNDTRVIPARFACRRTSGGQVGGLFLREPSPGQWEVMLKGAGGCRPGQGLTFVGADEVRARLGDRLGGGVWRLVLDPPTPAPLLLDRIGSTPLPPYIRRPGPMSDAEDRRAYQTVYAASPGAVAAPTAGLHFTRRVLDALRERGVRRVTLTLHVGLGTFAPVRVERVEDHRMHAEYYEIAPEVVQAVSEAKGGGRRVVAVGTTSVRALETAASSGRLSPAAGWTDLFLYPPARFRVVDALVTNFHLPRSTLLMLVAAFCSPGGTDGTAMILRAYDEAIRKGYRFYSYGDAMLIL